MWLCQNCAKLIDKDASRYTTDLLRRWCRLSEEAAMLSVELLERAMQAEMTDHLGYAKHDQALLIAGQHNPELLADYVAAEKRMGHTFRHDQSPGGPGANRLGGLQSHSLATE